MQETPAAQQAFEDYHNLGDGRSLPVLAEEYRARSELGQDVPTRQLSQLKTWSAEHGWQDRLRQRIAEDAERLREESQREAIKLRRSAMRGIYTDLQRYITILAEDKGKKPLLAKDAKTLETMLKLWFALAGDPLAERHEHTGAGGGAITIDDTRAAADRLAGLLAQAGISAAAGGDTEPTE